MLNKIKRSIAAVLPLMLAACTHQPLTLTTVFSENNCGLKLPTLERIERQEQLDEMLASIPKNFNKTSIVLPEIDYNESSVVLYALGQKPTAGFAIELTAEQARVSAGTLYLPIGEVSPPENSMNAQIITSPCSVFSLPKTEFSAVAIDTAIKQ